MLNLLIPRGAKLNSGNKLDSKLKTVRVLVLLTKDPYRYSQPITNSRTSRVFFLLKGTRQTSVSHTYIHTYVQTKMCLHI